MKKIFQITVLALLLAGCGSLKQGWNNFTAYYNTFYNAKKFYNAGLEKNRNQLPEINPMQPIRVYPSPTNAGMEDFEIAIEKGSSILLNHENSKFVIPALFIIGKSYFYRSEFFAALEKFHELETLASGEDRQQAIFWLGRTYLELSNLSQGIEELEFELDDEETWTPVWRAKTEIVLGELYVELENWEASANYLVNSLSEIEDHTIKARTHFLLGQVYEKMGDLNRALFAYMQINNLRIDYDLEFNATKKQAETSRKIGNYDYAVTLYQQMRRDDKFLEYRSDLQYEIARSLQMKGDQEGAIRNYNEVLKNDAQPASPVTMGRTYYGLGEIYRDDVKDLQMAAAYFDSAASQRIDENQLEDEFNARELADSFGEYVTVKQNIAEKDSLLNLAEMEPEELENFIEELRQREMEKVEDELERLRDQRDQMLVADQNQETVQAASTTEYGFLNIESSTRVADASLQFQAVWGDRPLVNNWRRRSAISGSRFDQISEGSEDSTVQNGGELLSTGVRPAIDTSNIPFTEDQKKEVKSEIEALNYRLGNTFFLSLDMPDSAKVYYKKVIDSGYNEDLVTKSLYSIAEVELLQDNMEEAEKWYSLLEEKDPGSVYSSRLAERLGIESPTEGREAENSSLVESNSNLSTDADSVAFVQNSDDQLIMLADSGSSEAIRPYLLLERANEYVQEARNEPGIDEEIERWLEEREEIESIRSQFETLKDSASVMLPDTSLTQELKQYWQQITDSTFSEPKFTEEYPFSGAYWDSARTVLQQIEDQYASSQIMPQVRILQETLANPGTDTILVSDSLSTSSMEWTSTQSTSEFIKCEELGINLDMEGGMDAFMNSLSFPSWTNDVSIRGELEYLFTIDPNGTIRSYEQLSRMDRSGIPQAVENGFEQSLQFTPPPNGEQVQCTVVFPFNL